MVGRTGRYLEIGNINPGLKYELDPSTLIFGNRSILGMVYYEGEHLQQALELMRRTRDRYPWDKVVSHTFPLERINEAFAEADQGRVTRAAIVPYAGGGALEYTLECPTSCRSWSAAALPPLGFFAPPLLPGPLSGMRDILAPSAGWAVKQVASARAVRRRARL